MIEGLLFGFFIILGLGSLFPRNKLEIGFTLFTGSILIPLILFLGVTIIGLPISWVGYLIIGSSFIGLLRLIFTTSGPEQTSWLYLISHPVFVLPALILSTGVLTDYSSYLLWNWDEFSSWASWAKQIFLADTSWRGDMINNYRTYPKGWPMAVAFAQLPFGDFNEYRGIALLSLFHVALLSLTFDLIRHIIKKETNTSNRISFLLSWTLILFLLSIESSWRLLPPSLLIERPVMYWTIGLFVLALMIWYRPNSQNILLVGIGITLASAFTLKTPTMGLAIPAAIFGFIFWKYQKSILFEKEKTTSLIKIISYLFVPLVLIVSVWYLYSDRGDESIGYSIFSEKNAHVNFFVITGLLKTAFIDYLVSYKFLLTILGLIGLSSGLWQARQRNLVIILFIFITVSWMGLWPLYMFNIQPDEYQVLPSFHRYARLPIRVIHYFGSILFVINLFAILKASDLSIAKFFQHQRLITILCSVTIIGLSIFQLWNINRSYLDMASRVEVSTTTDLTRHARAKKFRMHSEILKNLITKLDLGVPKIMFISQGGDGFSQRMATYYSIRDTKSNGLLLYNLHEGWSWGTESENIWMKKTSEKGFKDLILSSKIIWPHKLDAWSHTILANLIADKVCRNTIVNYFLVNLNGTLQCYSKVLN